MSNCNYCLDDDCFKKSLELEDASVVVSEHTSDSAIILNPEMIEDE